MRRTGYLLAVVAVLLLGVAGWFVWRSIFAEDPSMPEARQRMADAILERVTVIDREIGDDPRAAPREVLASLRDEFDVMEQENDRATSQLGRRQLRSSAVVNGFTVDELLTYDVVSGGFGPDVNTLAGVCARYNVTREGHWRIVINQFRCTRMNVRPHPLPNTQLMLEDLDLSTLPARASVRASG